MWLRRPYPIRLSEKWELFRNCSEIVSSPSTKPSRPPTEPSRPSTIVSRSPTKHSHSPTERSHCPGEVSSSSPETGQPFRSPWCPNPTTGGPSPSRLSEPVHAGIFTCNIHQSVSPSRRRDRFLFSVRDEGFSTIFIFCPWVSLLSTYTWCTTQVKQPNTKGVRYGLIIFGRIHTVRSQTGAVILSASKGSLMIQHLPIPARKRQVPQWGTIFLAMPNPQTSPPRRGGMSPQLPGPCRTIVCHVVHPGLGCFCGFFR